MHHDISQPEEELGQPSVEMCPLKTKRTHSPLPKGGANNPIVMENTQFQRGSLHLTAWEGSSGRSLGGSHQERVGLCCLESSAWSWLFPFAMGRLGFPLIVFNASAIPVRHGSLRLLHVAPPSYPHPFYTLKPLPTVPRNSPPSPVIFCSQDYLLGRLHLAYVRARDREGTQIPSVFCEDCWHSADSLSATHGLAELAFLSWTTARHVPL